MTYGAWLNEWLENYVKPTSKRRTYDRYRQLAAEILRRLGDVEINDLSPLLLQRYVTDLLETGNRKTGKGLSPNTVTGVVSKYGHRGDLCDSKFLEDSICRWCCRRIYGR